MNLPKIIFKGLVGPKQCRVVLTRSGSLIVESLRRLKDAMGNEVWEPSTDDKEEATILKETIKDLLNPVIDDATSEEMDHLA